VFSSVRFCLHDFIGHLRAATSVIYAAVENAEKSAIRSITYGF
jgi:hypothetical protein